MASYMGLQRRPTRGLAYGANTTLQGGELQRARGYRGPVVRLNDRTAPLQRRAELQEARAVCHTHTGCILNTRFLSQDGILHQILCAINIHMIKVASQHLALPRS